MTSEKESAFEPIAIVGRACRVPGANSPEALWDLVLHRKVALKDAPAGRWRAPLEDVSGDGPDRSYSLRGGYVDDVPSFARDDCYGAADDAIFSLSEGVVREALCDTVKNGGAIDGARTGLVMGNLGFPSEGHSRFAESQWMGPHADTLNLQASPLERFQSGLPAHRIASRLGMGAGAYCLDAACASSLYAIELACRALHDRRADVMVAGAVNRADDLFIHVGFCALGALSKTGQSRPFHAEADGLVPGEGAAFVTLMRLDDAVDAGREVYGVIRGVGLANDGRGRGFLAPSSEGQTRSMKLALAMAGMSPDDIAYVECHATGTRVGDATELASLAEAYGKRASGLPVGSLKGNLGHLITAAGAAGLIKVLEGLRHQTLPPSPHVGAVNVALAEQGCRLVAKAEGWSGPRRAAVSAFGFGGNDAHLIVETLEETREGTQGGTREQTKAHAPVPSEPITLAVVGLGARVASGAGAGDLIAGRGDEDAITLPLRGLRFPPNDLKATLPQQTRLLAAAFEALDGLTLPSERTGAFVAMGCDVDVARYGARWRAPGWSRALGADVPADGFVPTLTSAGVLGTMPNIPANRLSSQFDLRGPAYTISAEEDGGLWCLSIAAGALRRGELDAALVGAVDAAGDAITASALRALRGSDDGAADGAVVLVLMRPDDAPAERVLAHIEVEMDGAGASGGASVSPDERMTHRASFPRAHAAASLIDVAHAVALAAERGEALTCRSELDPDEGACPVLVRVRPAGSPRRLSNAAFPAPQLTLPAKLPDVPPPPSVGTTSAVSPAAVSSTRANATANSESTSAASPARAPLSDPRAPSAMQSMPRPPHVAPKLPHLVAAPSAESVRVPQAPNPSPAAVTAAAPAPAPSAAPPVTAVPVSTVPISTVPISTVPISTVPTSTVPVAAAPAVPTAVPAVPAALPIAAPQSALAFTQPAAFSVAGSSAPVLASSNYAEALADYGRRLAKAHQEFIASQQALHAEFLALRQHGSMLLLGVAGAQPAAVTHPLQPTAPAAPLLTRSGPARPTAHGTPTAPRQPPTAPRQPPTPNGTLPTASGTLPTGNGTLPIANGTLPTANGIAPSAQPSAPSTPHRAPSAQRPAPSAQRPAPSAQRSAPSAPRLAPSTQHPVPHAPTPSEPTTLSRDPVGRTWSREELRVHASGAISTIFDPTFAPQDKHAVQVRMPEPPLLLADRVVGIEAEPNALTNGKKNTGTVWTETDVRPNAWYLHRGHMPAGVMIESGQADLFLISYLGVDLLNQGERAYRLLGCELTYHGALPKVGETLRYEIDVDGHANQGDVRLFFFHYDCEVRGPTGNRPALSVRGGQAGFFTEQELAESAGVLWTPEEQTIVEQPRLDPPAVVCTKTSFSKDELEAFSRGDVPGCFGPGFEYAAPHNRTPRIAGDRMHFFDRVDECTPAGGPWGRGYLRATLDISTDDWFFEGHFKNDPCMPGTLMFEGCLQAMATYLTSLGYTLDKDGWRFEPIPEEKYALRCRGQVLPNAKVLTYEIFVEEVVAGPIPMLYADLLCTVDGLKAFHARRMGLRLVPDWPLEEWRDAPPSADAPSCAPQLTEDVASSIALLPLAAPPSASAVWPNDPNKRDFVFDYASLLACAWGKPSDAFGPMYGVFDSTRRVARLPGPPYHFMSRVTRINGELGACKPGAEIEIEYDVPEDVWYFAHGPNAPGVKLAMPFCVLLEAALQPCGWLASFVGSALTVDKDLSFRNLDGKGTVLAEVFPDSGVFRTVVKITNVSATAGMIIESFTVRCYVDHPDGTSTPAYELDTVFGFFPGEALENQVGLPTSDAQRAQLEGPSETAPIDLRTRPVCFCEGPLRLADPMLLMLDRITALEPKGGSEGLGFLRGEKDVDPNEWFFKAHFFQDPVQPGSLGIEAFLQLLQVYAIAQNLHEGMERPRFEAIACDHEHSWKYRGQVVPKNEVIGSTMEILEVLRDDAGVRLTGRASLWVDGKRIYEAPAIAIRVIDEAPEGDGRPKGRSLSETAGFGDGTRDAGRGTPDAGRGTPDAESGTRDAGRTTHDAESAMHDARRTTRDAESAMQVVGRGTQGAAGGAQGAGRRAQGAGRVARGAGRGVQDAGRGVRDVVSEAQFAQRGAQDAVGGERVLLEETFSARSHPWVLDHRPTFTVPALPMTVLADLMARALRAEGATRFDLSNLRALRWVTVHPTARVRVLRRGGELVLQQWRDARDPRLSRFEDAATAEARAPAGLEELAPLGSTRVFEPYERLFHGPAFQLLRRAEEGASGATSTLEARLGSAGHVPKGVLHPALLDAATHAIPHDSLHRWGDFPNDHVAYPHRLDLEWRRAPEGEAVRCETRLQRVEEGPGGPLPVFRIDVFDGAGCFARLRLVEVLLPKGPLGEASPSARRAFLESRRFVPGLALSDVREAGVTRVLPTAVATSDWLPGTIASVYGTPTRPSPELVAMKDHVAQLEGVHPSQVRVAGQVATNLHRPLRSHALSIESGAVSSRRSALNLEAVQSFWETRFGLRDWPVADLYYGLCQQFIDDVIVTDPDAFAAIRGRSALFLANHQTGIESLLFGILAGALQQTPVLTLAKDAHRESWLGKLIALGFEYPGAHDPGVIAFFNREDPASLPTIIQGLGAAAGASARGPRSLLVHVEGTRQLSARQPMASMSGVFVDLAIASDLPIVPVAFSGGLPVEPLETRAEFPIGRGGGFGKQQITLGAPILADSLRSMTYKDRNALVLDALRGLRSGSETPLASDASFRSERRPGAVARAVLQRAESPSAATRALLGEAVAVDTRVAAWLKGLEAWLNARP